MMSMILTHCTQGLKPVSFHCIIMTAGIFTRVKTNLLLMVGKGLQI